MNIEQNLPIIASDHYPQMMLDNKGNYKRAHMRWHRRFRYDPFAAGEEYVKNPWLLEDQIWHLMHSVMDEEIAPVLIERRVNHLNVAVSALATNPYFNTYYITQGLWMLALRLLWKGHVALAETMISRARFVDTVICRNPEVHCDVLITAAKIKAAAGEYGEACQLYKDIVRGVEKAVGWDMGVAYILEEQAEMHMKLGQYAEAADAYTRADEIYPKHDASDGVTDADERYMHHRANREKLTKSGFPPNPHRRRSRSEKRYLRELKLRADKSLAAEMAKYMLQKMSGEPCRH